MHQRQLQKIQKMEAILNEMNQTLEEVNAAFEKRKALRPQIKELLKYYESKALSVNISLQNNFKNLQNHSSEGNFFFY